VALGELEAAESVRAILLSSALKHFCAGADIGEMAEMTAQEAIAEQFSGCVSRLPTVSKPVIVAVRGLAAGGGCELVEMCDIVIAADSAKFCHPEITLAAMPGAGGTQRLSRVVGKHIAMDLLLTGRALSAEEAMAAGLVSRIVPDEQLEDVALAVARQVASFSSPVARRIKASVGDAQVNLANGLVAERNRFHECFRELSSARTSSVLTSSGGTSAIIFSWMLFSMRICQWGPMSSKSCRTAFWKGSQFSF